MRFPSGGYNACQFDHIKLRKVIGQITERLPSIMAETGATMLVGTGKSGISILTTLVYAMPDLDTCHVRKDGESSHGNMTESNYAYFNKYIIIDDFVASGKTAQNIIDRLEMEAHRRGDPMPECVGVFEYLKRDTLLTTGERTLFRGWDDGPWNLQIPRFGVIGDPVDY